MLRQICGQNFQVSTACWLESPVASTKIFFCISGYSDSLLLRGHIIICLVCRSLPSTMNKTWQLKDENQCEISSIIMPVAHLLIECASLQCTISAVDIKLVKKKMGWESSTWFRMVSATVSIHSNLWTPGTNLRCHPMLTILSIVNPSSSNTNSMLAASKHLWLMADRPADCRYCSMACNVGSQP